MNAVVASDISHGDIEIPFDHRQSAHCESGAISALLRHGNFALSEPMAFGISGALSYAYLPFVKFGGLPLFAYRMPPGHVIRGLTRRLGIRMHVERFRDPEAGMAALDRCLAAGRVVGIQTSAYWLTYFPPDMRFHFNAHNLVVYGRRGDNYLISDPVIDIRVECEAEALKKARFTRGVLAPKGLLYYPEFIPGNPDLPRAIHKAIRFTTGMMLYTPVPILGVRGIRTVARKIRRLDPARLHHNKLLLGHIVRMQEEIGTGGAGFRFLYASFLQEAAGLLNRPALTELADELTTIGDEWRRFALHAAKMCKDRMPMDYGLLANELDHCAEAETGFYRRLRRAVK
ncbi:MAG TPA: BtrH N-terminal domain-containing protein [Gammaproteobacteria bacterium]|nr:BtrH N-terminal domain-containing protein [Gammaproteobacteria bacterium]